MNKHTQNLTEDGIDYIRANMREMLQRSAGEDEVEDCPDEWIAEMVFEGLVAFHYENDCHSELLKMDSDTIDELCDDYLDITLTGNGWSSETKAALIELVEGHIEKIQIEG